VPVVVVADQQGQVAACDGFLDELGLLDPTGLGAKGREREFPVVEDGVERHREGVVAAVALPVWRICPVKISTPETFFAEKKKV